MKPVLGRVSTRLWQFPFSLSTDIIWKSLFYALAISSGCFLISPLFLYRPTKRSDLSPMEVNWKKTAMDHSPQSENASSAQLLNELRETFTPDVKKSLLLERQRKRKQLVSDVCKRLKASGQLLTRNKTLVPSQFHFLIVNDDLRLIYCEIPKVACTTWKKIMSILTGKLNATKPEQLPNFYRDSLEKKYLRRLDDFTLDEIQRRLHSYYKFMFVREPFERLLSAYFNKFTSNYNELFRRKFGRNIIRKYRSRPTRESLQKGHDVTFEEFIRYILDPDTSKKHQFDPHWRQYYELCHPCLVHYDVIGKYETLQEDARLVLSQVALRGVNVTFPTENPQRRKTSEKLAQNFSNISAADVQRLWTVYSTDFSLYGYPTPT